MIMISCKDDNRFPFKTKKARRPGPSDRSTDRWADRHTCLWQLKTHLKTAFQPLQRKLLYSFLAQIFQKLWWIERILLRLKDVNHYCMRGYGAGIDFFTPGRFLFRDGLYAVIGYYDINPKTVLELSLFITAPINIFGVTKMIFKSLHSKYLMIIRQERVHSKLMVFPFFLL